jgi:hypothetical protein
MISAVIMMAKGSLSGLSKKKTFTGRRVNETRAPSDEYLVNNTVISHIIMVIRAICGA